MRELADDWRYGGTLIDDVSHRLEAFNIILSMPRGTDPMGVLRSAREFARAELANHKYVLVRHDHQAIRTCTSAFARNPSTASV